MPMYGMKHIHKKRILELRAKGKTYKEICNELGCSKSTVAYHCGKGQKEKKLKRQQELRKENVLLKKVDNFKRPNSNRLHRKITTKSSPSKVFQYKARNFKRGNSGGKTNSNFTYREILDIYGEQTECYLTGKPINFKEPRTYNFDHIVPVSKGGSNNLENLGICTKEVNMAKSNLSVDDFIQLCKDVLEHNGYEVNAQVPER